MREIFASLHSQLQACEAKIRKNHLTILRLDFLRSNLWSNLQISTSNFTHRDPCLENINFDLIKFKAKLVSKLAMLCVSKAVSSPLTCSEVGGGFCIATLTTASRRGRVCFWQLSKRVRLNSSKRSAAKHKASIAVSSCLQAALAERSDGSERSES